MCATRFRSHEKIEPMKTLRTSRRITGVVSIVLALCGFAAGAQPADPRLLFYAPFEDSTDAVAAGGNPKALRAIAKFEDGKVGKAVRTTGGSYQRLAYDGRGNIDLNAGTLAFFFKPNYRIVEHAWGPIMCVGTDLEGYWAGVLQFNLIKDTINLQFFDVGRYAWPLTLPPVIGRWKEGEWVHLALVWDRNQGIRRARRRPGCRRAARGGARCGGATRAREMGVGGR